MKKLITATACCVLTISVLSAWNLNIQNLTASNDAAFGLFDSSGTLIGRSTSGNLRLGTFTPAYDAQAAWDSGDLSGLDTNFLAFGSSFGMNDFSGGFDGVFQTAIDQTVSSSLDNEPIFLWATNGSSFTDGSGEHLIYVFDQNFPEEVASPSDIILGVNTGSFIAGEFGNFSNDYSLGGGSRDGFNTVSPVPEPSTFALIAGCFGLAVAMVRRRV